MKENTIQIDWREWESWNVALQKLNELLAPLGVEIHDQTQRGDDYLSLLAKTIDD